MPNQRTGGNSVHRVARPRPKAPARTFGESADWSDHRGCEGLYGNRPLDLLRCLRPLQWLKCLLLLAAPFFAWLDPTQALPGAVALQERLGLALVAFALVVGGMALWACGSILPVIFIFAGCLAAPFLALLSDWELKERLPERGRRPAAAMQANAPLAPAAPMAANASFAAAAPLPANAALAPAKHRRRTRQAA